MLVQYIERYSLHPNINELEEWNPKWSQWAQKKTIGQVPLCDMVLAFVYMVINPVTPLWHHVEMVELLGNKI